MHLREWSYSFSSMYQFISNGWKRGFRVSHTRFSLGFAVLLYAVCNSVNADKLIKWFRLGDGLDLAALCAFLVAGLCLFTGFFALLAHRLTIKPLAILLTILSAAATYFIAKYNVAIDSSMVRNTIHTDITEVGQLLSLQMIPYVIFLVLLPTVIILKADITFRPSARYLLDSLVLIMVTLGVALACLYSNYNGILRAGNVSSKYIVYSLVPINIISSSMAVASKSLRPWLRRDAKAIEITGHVSAPGDLVVVLAIGESSRKKNFSLYGYQRRNTNPELQTISGLHLLNGIARRGSTLYALPQILEKNEIKLPMMVSRMGIPTACYVNYTVYDNCAAVGEITASHCRHEKCYDEDVVPLLENDLKSYGSGYRFLVLHLGGGSHGPIYGDRHPPEFLRFQPTCDDADIASKCTPEQVYNSYDNTILYVDHVVAEIIRTLDRRGAPYVLIYVSDHGESLMENGVMFHGMPPGMALPQEQAEVPLIVKSSVPITIAPRAEYLQPDIFDTVLALFSIQTDMFDASGAFIQKSAAGESAR